MRVLNVTTGCWIRLTRAERAIREAAAAWVEDGKTIRNLSLAESITARREQQMRQEQLHQPLDLELRGLKWEPPITGIVAHRVGRQLSLDAHAICVGIYHPSEVCA
jgi:hypothetical protein